jgi:hypothetical protein
MITDSCCCHLSLSLSLSLSVSLYTSVGATSWSGTWTGVTKYGGQTYTCVRGNTVYGVYSNGGIFEGTIQDSNENKIEGIWFEGGRGDRNVLQGSFTLTLSDDGQHFDGIYYRVTGESFRWRETRLGSPYPSDPTDMQCLVPDGSQLDGTLSGGSPNDLTPGLYSICIDSDIRTGQVYGSFSSPTGFLEGWHFRGKTGFHGYRYTNDGLSGAYILRAINATNVSGFYWRGRLNINPYGTSRSESLTRVSATATRAECEATGPGFLLRLRGPSNSSASTLAVGVTAVVAVVLAVLAL